MHHLPLIVDLFVADLASGQVEEYVVQGGAPQADGLNAALVALHEPGQKRLSVGDAHRDRAVANLRFQGMPFAKLRLSVLDIVGPQGQ